MNQTISRELLAHGLIIAAVCVGGWVMLVQPKANALAELESTIEASQAGDVPMTQAGIEQLTAQLEGAKQRLDVIRARNALAHDSTQLFGRIMQLANEHGVTIERLQPGTTRRKLPDDTGTAVRVDLTANGDYQDVARFLDGVVRMSAFVRPVSLSLQPSGDVDQFVSARLVCEALSFKLPEELASMEGGNDADH